MRSVSFIQNASHCGGAIGLAVSLLFTSVAGALTITNVTPANVTPSSFSIFWQTGNPATPSISVFADANGQTNLAGQLGIEVFPLHTGNPELIEPYARRQYRAGLQLKTRDFALMQVKVTGCQPNTTYYYRLQATGLKSQRVYYPSSGPLPSVTTAAANSFVTDARQLFIEVPGNSEGRILTLANTNSAYPLTAVVGDGAPTNQACFNLTDLFAQTGGTNFLLLGQHEFKVELPADNGSIQKQNYILNFTANFMVSDTALQVFGGDFLVFSLGEAILRTGDSNSLSIGLNSGIGITNIALNFSLPTNRFSDLAVQANAPGVAASLQANSPGFYTLRLSALAGQPMEGAQSNVVQLSFTTRSNQSSAIVQLRPESFVATRADGGAVARNLVNPGKIVVIGEEPLLEALVLTNTARGLVLYGKPGSTYAIQVTTNLAPAEWTEVTNVALVTLSEALSGFAAQSPTVFYRAYDISDAVPRLQAGASGASRTLTITGKAGRTYELQSASSLSAPVAWSPVVTITMTNPVAVQNVSSNPQVFYRIKLR